ncbi:MAG: TIR domain-containing protein [Saprospiraceae bacterium]|nr:TIR domain-containing protein [Saprospiraceae bacterium]
MLHQKGIVFYLPEHPILKDSVWINPSTISDKIYEILDKASLLDSGELKEKDFDSHINQDSDLKTLLIHQEVLFIDDSEERIIIPQYLPLVSDDDFLLDLASEGMETLFAIRFKDFMPHGLMSRLMCRLGKNPGRKILKRNEFICRLCISSPEEKIESVKIKVSCDMINLKLHIQASKDIPEITSKMDLQKYLFKVVLAAYWNEEHLEFYEKPRSVGDGMGRRTTIDPLWIDMFLYKYTFIDFEISSEFDIWVNYKQELFAANMPEDAKINPVVNGKKYYYEMVHIDDFVYNDIIHYKNPSSFVTSKENRDIITGYVEESFDKVQIKASLFNAFIVEQVSSPKKVFVSYAHADTEHRQTLQKYLINLQRENLIEIWHDGLINPGDDWDEKIIHSIEEADIVILLVSQSFIASSYIYNTEMPKALEKVLNKKGVIFPFILENCDWKKWNILMHFEAKEKSIIVGKYQTMPVHPGQGIMQPLESKVWANSSDAWMVLVEEMRKLIGTA